jgi:hypothetical protein
LLFLSAAPAALAQPAELGANARKETPGPYGLAALSFELNAPPVERGAVELQLELPGGPRAILRRGAFQSRGEASGLWRGSANLRGDSEVLLTLRNGYVAGAIQIGTDLYEVRPAGNRHVIEKLDVARFPACGGQQPAGDTGGVASGETAAASGDALVTVDLLSVYTPQARTAAGGTAQIETLIQSAVDRANLAFSNSLVNAAFRLVGTAEVGHSDAGDLGVDLSWVRNDATVAALRNESGADMVSLIVENGAGYCGMGYVMNSVGSGFAGSAFQVTARSCAVGNLTFAHEHGHNLGMQHDPANGASPTSASYPWSFGHFNNGAYRTVMSYASECPNGCTRVPYFSNPDVVYSGYPTGIPDQRDNARTARTTMAVASGFRAEASTSAPAAPSGLTATATSSTLIQLAWSDNSGNESGFRIERAVNGGGFATLASTAAGATSYSNSGLTGGTAYTYRVRAFNAAGESDPTVDAGATTPAPQPPAAPQSLTATAVSSTQINLAWADQSGNETGFKVERSTDGVSFTQVATTGANVAAYGATGLAAGTTYHFRVRAYNGDGNSAYTNSAVAATPQGTPAAPSTFAGVAQYAGSGKNKTLTAIALSWTDVAGNDGYNLERCLRSGKGRTTSCTYSNLASPGANQASHVDATATTKGTYQYRIRSFNAVGASAWVEIQVAAN